MVNSGTATNLYIDSTVAHNNVRIVNNLVVQNTPGTIANVPNDSAFTFSNNLWSKTPEADAKGTGDIIANPKLINANASLSPGNVDPNWYGLTSTSPAINKALKLTEVIGDFFGSSRDNSPDIGAHEYNGIPQPTEHPSPTPTGGCQTGTVPGDANGDCHVDGFDYVFWWQNFGKNVGGGPSQGDFNRDGTVDGFDYVVWWQNFGT